MSYSYQPLTEEQCSKERGFALLDPGIYNFEVLTADYKTSSTGNPMIALKLRVWGNDGKDYLVYDYLVATNKMMWKTKHFCDSVGLDKIYASSNFNEALCPGKSGKALISLKIGNKKPDGTSYADKNAVDDYVMTDKGATKYDSAQPFIPPKHTNTDDDLPF